MFHNRGLALAVALAMAACASQGNRTTVRDAADAGHSVEFKRVDAIFSAWTKPNSPGCALAVLKDGHTLYSHGYGLSDVEHSVPITPTTVFHVASVSKQFTAFAIYLLVQDGKLSLDDDIRKYLPELHDFHKTITIRELLHHTSGLRDQWDLLAMAGRRLDDVITEQEVLNLIWRQQELNFPPGQEFLYSNTGYTLLALIVERVSGMSFRKFTDSRIFKPLGMSHTHFHEYYGDLVYDRAYSYEPPPRGGYEYVALSYSTVGPSSLFTTVEDLRLWDENFYTGIVGGKNLLARMQIKGKLNNGKEIDYASGLVIGEYRGLKTVEHAGADAGFRSEILRFPDAHFSVVVLCNAGEADPTNLARKTADIFLNTQLEPLPPPPPPPLEIKIDPKRLDAYVGYYELAPGFILTITREGDQLVSKATGQASFWIFPSSETKFFMKAFEAQLTFDTPQGGKATGLTLHQDGLDHYAKRIERLQFTTQQLQQYVGSFYSTELDKSYTVSTHNNKLFITDTRRNDEMFPTGVDTFDADSPFDTIEYQCTKAHLCNSFLVNDVRVRGLRFQRVDLKPIDASIESWGRAPTRESTCAHVDGASAVLTEEVQHPIAKQCSDDVQPGSAGDHRQFSPVGECFNGGGGNEPPPPDRHTGRIIVTPGRLVFEVDNEAE
jgi:CubicO group peptidase (beta-lactamase class C family)